MPFVPLARAPQERETIKTPTWDQWLTKLVTAVNDIAAGGGTFDAGNLTGTTLAANVVNSSLVITDGQLSSNIALKNGTNAFSGANSFATNPVDLLVGQLVFPATQNPSANANTLDDYEEGTWTPTDTSGAGLVLTGVSGKYQKLGNKVAWQGQVTYPATASGAAASLGPLPFTPNANFAAVPGFQCPANTNFLVQGTNVLPVVDTTGTGRTNATFSGMTVVLVGLFFV